MRQAIVVFLLSGILTASIAFAPAAKATWYQTYPGTFCNQYYACPVINLNGSNWEMASDNITTAFIEVDSTVAQNLSIEVCNWSYSESSGSCASTNYGISANTPTDIHPNLPTTLGGSLLWDQFQILTNAPSGNLRIYSYGVWGS